MSGKRISYYGKKVYVGIDVHKRTYSVYCVMEGALVKKATVPALPVGLAKSLNSWFEGGEIYSAYEAGFSGFLLHRVLVGAGIRNIVVNASAIEVAANDKVKTDKRDCRKIAVQLAARRLKGICIPSEEQEQIRLITRTREQLVRERVRVGHQFKSRLYQFGLLSFDDEKIVRKKFIEAYLQVALPDELKVALESLARIWKSLDEEIKNLEKHAEKQAATDKNELVYRSVPGIGAISSRILSNELGDMSQFKNERALFCHTGMTPSEFSSGENRRQGHISRQGSSRLRCVLVEVAWRAIDKDEKLRQDFDRISLRAGKKRAIVAIARKLIGRVRACFKKGCHYELSFGLAT